MGRAPTRLAVKRAVKTGMTLHCTEKAHSPDRTGREGHRISVELLPPKAGQESASVGNLFGDEFFDARKSDLITFYHEGNTNSIDIFGNPGIFHFPVFESVVGNNTTLIIFCI